MMGPLDASRPLWQLGGLAAWPWVASSPLQPLQHHPQWHPQRLRHVLQLDHIQSSLTGFVLTDERLRHAQLGRYRSVYDLGFQGRPILLLSDFVQLDPAVTEHLCRMCAHSGPGPTGLCRGRVSANGPSVRPSSARPRCHKIAALASLIIKAARSTTTRYSLHHYR